MGPGASTPDGSGARTARTGHRVLVVLLLALAAAARVYGAWAMRYITDADSTVVALMARHMARGAPWPVFFYGQAYMGSLEPAASALLVRLLGENGFAVCLGPVLFAIAVLPLVYAWARDAGGRAAGIAALAFVALGPRVFFLFQFAPRGGYVSTLFFATAVLWMGARMAAREARGEPAPRAAYLLLGLLAGLGWWCSQMVTSALLVAAVLLALGLRGRLGRAGVALGLAGFLAGGAPFWWWNLRHGFESFAMASQLGALPLGRGWRLAAARYDTFLGLPAWLGPAQPAVAAAIALWIAAGALLALARFARAPRGPAAFAGLAAALHAGLSLAVYLGSRQVAMNTGRYFIPMVPSFAVLAGLAAAALGRRAGPWAAAAPVAAAVVLQLPVLGELRAVQRDRPARQRMDRELLAAAAGATEAVYAHLHHYELNWNGGGRVVVTPFRGERHPPHAQRAETARRVGVIDNYGGIRELLALSGGKADGSVFGRHTLHTAFRAPADALAPVPPGAWSSVRDAGGADLAPRVADRNMDTVWAPPSGADRASVEIRFARPVRLAQVRLWATGPHAWPPALRVETSAADDGPWREVRAETPLPLYHWSGPRPYWIGRRHRLALRLGGEPVRAVRLSCADLESGHRPPWRLCEIDCFEAAEGDAGAGGPPHPEEAAAPALARALLDGGAHAVYADRWLSEQLARLTDGALRVEREPRAFPENAWPRDGRVELDAATAVVVLRADAPVTAATLERQGIGHTRSASGPWTVFSRFRDVPAGPLPLYWTGCHLLAGHGPDCAAAFLSRASEALAAVRPDEAAAATRRALALFPGAITDAGDLLAAFERLAPGHLDPAWRAAYREAAVPDLAVPARFAGGIELLGLEIRPREVLPSGRLRVRYFWRLPAGASNARAVVFVHLRGADGRMIAQDDHALPAVLRAPAPRRGRGLCVETREIELAADAAEGPCRLQIGLWEPAGGKRWRVNTRLDSRDRAVIVDDVFRVVPAGRRDAREGGPSA